jgi:predicted metal-dependent RNase
MTRANCGYMLDPGGAEMCNGGQIVHHLKRTSGKKGNSRQIVGFQGYGSLGRRLVEGRPRVSICGEKVVVRGSSPYLKWIQRPRGKRQTC